MKVMEFVKRLFQPQPVCRPDDLKQFDDARERLHRTSRALVREADAFGDMVREMRGDRLKKPCATKSVEKTIAKKRKARKK